MRIEEIHIKNYKSLKEVIIEGVSDNGLVLVGKNNVGKSSVLEAIQLFIDNDKPDEKHYHKDAEEIVIKIKFILDYNDLVKLEEKRIVKKTEVKGGEPLYFYIEKRFSDGGNGDYTITETNYESLKGLDNKSKIKKIYKHLPFFYINDERNIGDELDTKSKTHISNFFSNIVDLKAQSEIKKPLKDRKIDECDIGDLQKALKSKVNNEFDNLSNVASNIFGYCYDEKTSLNHKCNQKFYSSHFSLERFIKTEYGDDIDLEETGAGTRSLFLFSLIRAYYEEYQSDKKSIFCIEEPEIYLHPSLKKKFGEILSKMSKDNQIFITTHSPFIVKSFDLNMVRKVTKKNGESQISQAKLNDILQDLGYSLFDILDKKYVILVEGKSDKKIYSQIIKKFYSDKVDIDEIQFIGTGGSGNLDFYAALKIFGLMFSNNRVFHNWIIIRDQDNYDESKLKTDFKTNLENNNINKKFVKEIVDKKYKILNRYSVENIFVDKILLDKVFKSLGIEKGFELQDFLKSSMGILNHTKNLESKKNLEKSIEKDWENVKKIRGHNWMSGLCAYGQIKKDELIEEYINEMHKDDLEEVKLFFDDLFDY